MRAPGGLSWSGRAVADLEELSREQLIVLVRQFEVQVAGLVGGNARLVERTAALEQVNGELAGRVARLEQLLSRNSGDSSFPPSVGDQPGRSAPDKPAGKRKPGRQRGTPGAHLEWDDHPDDTVPHFRRERVRAAPAGWHRGSGRGGLPSAGRHPAGVRAGGAA